MTEIPYMELYPADYLADTMHLTLEQHGAYLKLLMIMWRAGGWLDDNDKKVATMLGITPKKWQSLKTELEPFFIYKNEKFSQKRLDAQMQGAIEKRKKKSAAGIESSKAKKLKNNDSTSTPVDIVLPDVLQQNEDSVATIRAETQHQHQHTTFSDNSLRSLSSNGEASSPPEKKSDANSQPKPEPPPPPDLKKIIFTDGLATIGGEKYRPLVGRWIRDYGEKAVISAMIDAQKASAVEPIAYIEKTLQGGKNATANRRKNPANEPSSWGFHVRQPSQSDAAQQGTEPERFGHEPPVGHAASAAASGGARSAARSGQQQLLTAG